MLCADGSSKLDPSDVGDLAQECAQEIYLCGPREPGIIAKTLSRTFQPIAVPQRSSPWPRSARASSSLAAWHAYVSADEPHAGRRAVHGRKLIKVSRAHSGR